MIVADTNLIAYLVLPGERTEESESVLMKDSDWVVPVLWSSELRSVVGSYIRTGHLTLAQGCGAMERAIALVGGREAPVDSREVLTLAHRSGCSSSDCEYVALATALGVRLVTSDKDVLRAFPGVAINPGRFLE